ncbi:reverse transcriptase domain-containing protein [Tanacetum coccineum]
MVRTERVQPAQDLEDLVYHMGLLSTKILRRAPFILPNGSLHQQIGAIRTSSQNATKSIIEGHISALKELLKEPTNRDLIKPMLLDFDDVQDVSDDKVEVNTKGNAKMGDKDLSKPFKEVLKCPFTRRIVEFSSPVTRGKTSNPEDHVGRFMGMGNQGEWPMPVFGMLKACDKDPTEISKIVQRANETLPNFKERWVSESNAIPNVPELMQISSFVSSHKCRELSKCFSDNIPKTVDEMLKRVDDYLRSEEAFRNTELPKGEFQQKEVPLGQWGQRNERHQRMPYGNHRRRPEHKPTYRTQEHHAPYVPPHRPNQEFRRPRETRAVLTLDSLVSTQEILATEHQLHLPQPAPLVGIPSKEKINKYYDYHNEKGHITNDCFHLKKQLEIALESGKLNHLVKDVRQRGKGGQRNNGSQKGKEDLVVEGEIEGYLVRRIHIDEGASVEIMFKQCFNMLHPSIRARLVETQTTISGFLGEQVKSLGKIELDVCFGGSRLCRRAIMKFAIIPAPSPYNIILGRPGLKQLRAIPSTIHGMIKFPTPWGIATLVSQAPIIFECRREGKKQAVERPKETEPVITKEVAEWLKAGIVRPVKYPTWISNPVLVKKVDGSWRMCIDFKNINSACPKDYYPLPEIDSKIESVVGFLKTNLITYLMIGKER